MKSFLDWTFPKVSRRRPGVNSRPARMPRTSPIESLEQRSLPSGIGLADPQPVLDAEPNNTIDAAQQVGTVTTAAPAELVGMIGDHSGYSADVDWYQFSLTDNAQVQLAARPTANGSNSPVVLTLYTSHFTEYDPTNQLGHWLLAQSEGSDSAGAAEFTKLLGPGTYFLAVSGGGNRFFHPYLADSGVLGSSVGYDVQLTASAADQAPNYFDVTSNQPRFTAYETRRGDDTPATSTDLGDLTNFTVLQAAGAIGDDPFYNTASENPLAQNPAADVDLYHFQVTGEGRFAFVAEAFAGRIGSMLDPALTLFRKDDAGTLQLVATNNNTLDPTVAANGTVPLYTDSLLSLGLEAGDYFLAVSSVTNAPNWGPDGVFDPHVAHSGLNGGSIGEYVVSLHVVADNTSPEVLSGSINNGDVLTTPPTNFVVQFTEPVNLQQLAFNAFQQTASNDLNAVFIQSADGTKFFPRMQSYDPISGKASFLMLDALPDGDYQLHFSGALGITDLANWPLIGNDFTGDFVVRFSVQGSVRGHNGDPLTWITTDANDSVDAPQNLGVLFPHELQATVQIVRDAATSASLTPDTADAYQFEVLQTQTYFITLTNLGSSAATPNLEVIDAVSYVVDLVQQGSASGIQGTLHPGKYVLRIGSWSSAESVDVAYRVELKLGAVSENPTPLTNGAAPAVSIQLNLGIASGSKIGTNNLANVVEGSLSSESLVTFYIRPTAINQPAVAPSTPSGLLDGLNAAAIRDAATLGAYASRLPLSQDNSSQLVRLFGFNDRDRFFTLLDNVMTREDETLVDREENLPAAELFDRLVKVTKPNLDEESPANEADDPSLLDQTLNDVDTNLLPVNDNVAGAAADQPAQSPHTKTDQPSRRQQTRRREIPSEPVSQVEIDDLRLRSAEINVADNAATTSGVIALPLIAAATTTFVALSEEKTALLKPKVGRVRKPISNAT